MGQEKSTNIKDYRFYKEDNGSWYADLPGYPGPKGDLLMVAGADKMLDVIAKGGNECVITASEEPFKDSNECELLKKSGGGGDYIIKEFRGQTINHELWLCSVVQYVFGKVPQRIYFKI